MTREARAGASPSARKATSEDGQVRETMAGLHAVMLLGSFMHSSPQQQNTAELAAGGLAAIARVPLAAVAWYPEGSGEQMRLVGRYAGKQPIPARIASILVRLCSQLNVYRPARLEEAQLPGRLRLAGVKALLAIPLRVGTDCVGFLLAGGAVGALPEDLMLVQALGAQTSTALYVARTQEYKNAQMSEQARLLGVLREQGELLSRALRLQEDLIDLVLHGKGVGEIIEHLAGQLKAPVWLVDAAGHVIAHARSPYGVPEAALPRTAELRRALDGLSRDPNSHPIEVATGTGGLFLLQTVATDRDVFGHLLIGSAPLDALDRTVIHGGCLVLALRLLIERSIADAQERSGRDLIEDALLRGNGRASSALAARLGYEQDGPAMVLVVRLRLPPAGYDHRWDSVRRRVMSAVQDEFPGGIRGLAGLIGEEIIAIVRPEAAEACERRILSRATAGAPDVQVTIGVSDVCASVGHLQEAHRQARQAAALAEGIPQHVLRFTDLGLYRLLFDADHANRIDEHIERWLGPLLRYDTAQHTRLVETLARYLTGTSRKEEVALDLSIHVSTLKYRLRRIREILTFDFMHPEARFNVELALRLAQIREDLFAGSPAPSPQLPRAAGPRAVT
ncbi:MAG TPA: helix-turn-helix domain-containing protein [Streptosporangiaceae bacterium]